MLPNVNFLLANSCFEDQVDGHSFQAQKRLDRSDPITKITAKVQNDPDQLATQDDRTAQAAANVLPGEAPKLGPAAAAVGRAMAEAEGSPRMTGVAMYLFVLSFPFFRYIVPLFGLIHLAIHSQSLPEGEE